MVTVLEADRSKWDREFIGETESSRWVRMPRSEGTYHTMKGLAKWGIHWPDGPDHSVGAIHAYLHVLILLLQKYS